MKMRSRGSFRNIAKPFNQHEINQTAALALPGNHRLVGRLQASIHCLNTAPPLTSIVKARYEDIS